MKCFYPPRILEDASVLVYKHRPKIIGFNKYAENTQQQLIFLALLPWLKEDVIVFLSLYVLNSDNSFHCFHG